MFVQVGALGAYGELCGGCVAKLVIYAKLYQRGGALGAHPRCLPSWVCIGVRYLKGRGHPGWRSGYGILGECSR